MTNDFQRAGNGNNISSIFLELPLFMGRTALIFQNRFFVSALFRNFARQLIKIIV